VKDGPRRRVRSAWLLPTELVVTAAVSTALFAWLRMEFVWVLTGLVVGWAVTAAFRRRADQQAPNPRTRQVGQVLVGVSLGPVLAAQSMGDAVVYLPLLLGAVVVVLAGSVAIARTYARSCRVDGLTAGLATLPGGIGIMASVAAETGGKPALVALVQGVRVALVVSVIPAIIVLGGGAASAESELPAVLPQAPGGYAVWAALLVGAFLASTAAKRLGVPVASLLGPMALGLVAALAVRLVLPGAEALEVPYLHSVAGQALLGITVGEYLAQDSRTTRRAFAGGFAGVVATFALSLAVAVLVHALTPWSFLTCVLLMAPGGAPEMIVLAAATPSELHLVVIAQMARQIAVNALMPLWLRLFRGFGVS
jgi:membrane AbrB-like protein